jgi:hypothetical protein
LISGEQDDISAIITFLFELFPLQPSDSGIIKETRYLYKNKSDRAPLTEVLAGNQNGPLFLVNPGFMERFEITELSKVLNQSVMSEMNPQEIKQVERMKGTAYKYSKYVLKCEKFPKIMIFEINRGRSVDGNNMLTNKVYPTPIIKNQRTVYSIICKTSKFTFRINILYYW